MRKRLAFLFFWASLYTAFACAEQGDDIVVLDDGQGLRAAISPVHGGELTGLEIRQGSE